jgi:FkbM family methyltransferase
MVRIPSYFLGDNLIYFLKEQNYQPKLILDIGANHGRWTRKWKKQFKATRFIMIEPQEWLKASFKDLLNEDVTYIHAGAGNENGKMNFTINSNRDDSSTFALSEEEATQSGFQQIEVEVLTVNEIIKRSGGQVPDIVKIDAEGLDMKVLLGADLCFGKTDIFMIEASVNNFDADNNLLSLITYMDVHGYKVFDFTELNRPFPHGGLWQVEIAFVKKDLFRFQ